MDFSNLKKVSFHKKTQVQSSKGLEEAFGCTDIHFEKDAVVVFTGSALLAPGVHFRGTCEIGDDVSIDTGCVLENVAVGPGTIIRSNSVLTNCRFQANNTIGPFCFVRDNVSAGESCIIGAHVEITRSWLGNGVKISHQAVVGDATLRDRVIIGAGVVFCNFDDGIRQSAEIKEDTTVGSGSLIISPVVVGSKVIIGAGSIVNKDIGDNERLIQKRYSDFAR